MLISHESPMELLDKSLQYNDYQYALVHLFEDPKIGLAYYEHFDKCIENGVEVLLDNSIFELGVAFNSDKYAAWIEKLKPSHYIVPDVLEDGYSTMVKWVQFVESHGKLPGNKIGVVQGKTYQELVDCYRFMDANADYIAISFDYSYYQTTGLGNTKLKRMASGRLRLINSLMEDLIWNPHKPHHLLGCSLPIEFKEYANVRSIRSVDTSNPIMAGIKGMNYVSDFGLYTKPDGLLAGHMEHKFTDEQLSRVDRNIREFRMITRGF